MGYLRAKPSVIFVVVIVAIFGTIWFSQRLKRAPLKQREVVTRVLADYIRKTARPGSVLVVSNPYVETKGRPPEVYAFHTASEAGLRAGLGDEIKVKVGFPKLKPEGSAIVDPETTTPLSYMVNEGSFDELVRANPECDALVSLIGLPADTVAAGFWNMPKPRLALLLPDFRVIGAPEMIRSAFKSGKIIATVARKPGAPHDDQTTESSYKAEFDKRFILVTADNIDERLGLLLR